MEFKDSNVTKVFLLCQFVMETNGIVYIKMPVSYILKHKKQEATDYKNVTYYLFNLPGLEFDIR